MKQLFLLICLILFPIVAQAETLLWERILVGESLQQKLNQVYTPPIEESARQEDIRTLAFRKEFSINNQLPLMKFVEALSKKENDPQRTLLLETIPILYPNFPLNPEIQYLLGQSYLTRYQENPNNKTLKEKSEKSFQAFLKNFPQKTATLNAYPHHKAYIRSGLNLGPYALMGLSQLYKASQPVTRESLSDALKPLNQIASDYAQTFNENGESFKLLALLQEIALIRQYPHLMDAKSLAFQETLLDDLLEYPDRALMAPGNEKTYIHPYYYQSMGDIFFARQEPDRAVTFYRELVLKYGDTVKWEGKQDLLNAILQKAIQEPEFEPYALRFFQELATRKKQRGYIYGYWIPLIYDGRGEKEKALEEYKKFLIVYSQAPDYVEKKGEFVFTEMGLAKNRIEQLLGDPETIQKLYTEIEQEAPDQAYDLNFRIASLYDQIGQKEKALVLYKQFVKKFSMYPDQEESLFLTRKTQKGIAKERIKALVTELDLDE